VDEDLDQHSDGPSQAQMFILYLVWKIVIGGFCGGGGGGMRLARGVSMPMGIKYEWISVCIRVKFG